MCTDFNAAPVTFFRAYVTGDGSVEDILVTEMKYGCALQNYGNDNEAR